MKISVCLATYNGEKFILRQLNSVISQISIEDQVIVVDDCSTDNTVGLIKESFGERVEIKRNSTNMGVIKSFEKAISFATGDVIFLCDQDDIWETDKVSKVIKAFEHQEAVLVAHDAFVVDGAENLVHPSWNSYNNNKKKGIVGNIVKNSFTGCCMAFKKELKKDILPFPEQIDMHDQYIALVAMVKKQKIVYIDEPLMKYVRHGGNVTGTKKRTLAEQLTGRVGTVTSLIKAMNKN